MRQPKQGMVNHMSAHTVATVTTLAGDRGCREGETAACVCNLWRPGELLRGMGMMLLREALQEGGGCMCRWDKVGQRLPSGHPGGSSPTRISAHLLQSRFVAGRAQVMSSTRR